jgi:putative flippase GtrA
MHNEHRISQRDRRLALLSEITRYLGAGAVSYGMGIALSALFHEIAGLRQEIAVALSLVIVMTTNFWIARMLIFRATGSAHGQFVRFALTSLIMRGIEYVSFMLLLHQLGINYLVSLTVAMVLSTCVKFFIYRTFVFGKSPPGALRQSTPDA